MTRERAELHAHAHARHGTTSKKRQQGNIQAKNQHNKNQKPDTLGKGRWYADYAHKRELFLTGQKRTTAASSFAESMTVKSTRR